MTTATPAPAIRVATLHRRSAGYALHCPPLGWLYLSNRLLTDRTGSSRIPQEMALGLRLGWDNYDPSRPGPAIRRYRVARRGEMLEFDAMGEAS